MTLNFDYLLINLSLIPTFWKTSFKYLETLIATTHILFPF